MIKKFTTLILILSLSLLPLGSVAYAYTDSDALRAEILDKYGVNITIKTVDGSIAGEDVLLKQMGDIKHDLEAIPEKLISAVKNAQFNSLNVIVENDTFLYGEFTEIGNDNGRTGHYSGNGTYDNTITLFNTTDLYTFAHEYGHYLTYKIASAVGLETIKNEWCSFMPNAVYGSDYYSLNEFEQKNFISPYAYTSFTEDMAETFAAMITADENLRVLIKEVGNEAPLVKKIRYWESLLNKAFNIEDNLFEKLYPQTPSSWAEKSVEKFFKANNSMGYFLKSDTYLYQAQITRKDFACYTVSVLKQYVWEKYGKVLYDVSYGENFSPTINSVIDINNGENLKIVLNNVFTDIEDTDVTVANYFGIVYGNGQGHFMPDEKISRQDAACILRRLCEILKLYEKNNSLAFDDASDISDYAYDSVKYVTDIGIMHGTENNRFSPAETFTYEQAYVALSKILDKFRNV